MYICIYHIYLSIYLFIYLSIYPSIYLSIYLHISYIIFNIIILLIVLHIYIYRILMCIQSHYPRYLQSFQIHRSQACVVSGIQEPLKPLPASLGRSLRFRPILFDWMGWFVECNEPNWVCLNMIVGYLKMGDGATLKRPFWKRDMLESVVHGGSLFSDPLIYIYLQYSI